MKLIINGRHIDLTEGLKAHVAEKVARLEHHYDFIQEIHVFLSVEKNPRISAGHHAEATVVVSRAVLRVETASEDLYSSIDQLVDKVERVLTRHKTKLLGRAKSAKGESIRKAELSIGEEAVDSKNDPDMEGVFFTYHDEEETAETA